MRELRLGMTDSFARAIQLPKGRAGLSWALPPKPMFLSHALHLSLEKTTVRHLGPTLGSPLAAALFTNGRRVHTMGVHQKAPQICAE